MIQELWHSKHRAKAIRAVKNTVILIVKAVIPKSLYFNIIIGQEDPAKTGQLMAKFSLLYPLYYSYGTIEGNAGGAQ